ncbi:histidinol-phosphate transaminase [Clostridium sediminicola]|uniref:pyridoxal phosphate-dependent aminotransferase n=1 Tax=Clostridium sediminicola TaxID=3114879 RepID=UPI0031F1D82E
MHGGDIYTHGILKGKNLIDFSSNINPLGVPKSFTRNIDEALSNLNKYPDIHYRKTIEYLKEYTGKDKVHFLLGNGAAELLDLSIALFKKVVLVVPSFIEYEESAVKWGSEVNYSYLNDDFTINYEDILEKLESNDALIIANPNNPNGGCIESEKLQPIMEYCERHNKKIIIDEAFIEFAGINEFSLEDELDKFNCLIIIRALTKFFALPGIRFGYAMTKDKLLYEKIQNKQLPWNINCFAESAVKHVLFDEEYIQKSNSWLKEEKEYFLCKLRKLNVFENVYDTNGNYILCKLNNLDCNELYNRLSEKDILIRRCDDYIGLSNKYIRIAIKDRKLNDILLRSLKEIDTE